jgi:copper chaperone
MSAVPRTFEVTGMTCDHCKQAVESEIEALDDVAEVVVDVDRGLVTVDGLPTEKEITEAIERAGYEVAGKR